VAAQVEQVEQVAVADSVATVQVAQVAQVGLAPEQAQALRVAQPRRNCADR
jgi:hypothetical protein